MIYSTVNKALVFTLCLRSGSAMKPINSAQGRRLGAKPSGLQQIKNYYKNSSPGVAADKPTVEEVADPKVELPPQVATKPEEPEKMSQAESFKLLNDAVKTLDEPSASSPSVRLLSPSEESEEKCKDEPMPIGEVNNITKNVPVKKIDHGLRRGAGTSVYNFYKRTHDALRERLGTDPANLILKMSGAKIPYTKEGFINLKYDWTTAEAEKLRKRGPKITGLELRGYEQNPKSVAWSVPVSDGFYNLVPPSFPIDLDAIDIDGAKTFDASDPQKINRNRFNEWGPYYIKQSLDKNGDMITNVIARKMVMDERGPPTKWGSARYHLRWCYFTFGKTDHWNESRRDTIDINLVGYDVLDNHEPNTTLILEAGKDLEGRDGKRVKLRGKVLARKDGKTIEDGYDVKYSREACCNLKEVLLEVTPLDQNSINLVKSFLVEGETEGALDGERIVCNWGGSRDPRILRDDFFEDDFNNGRRRLMDAKRIRQHSMLRELYQ